jgi:hypothetical protein
MVESGFSQATADATFVPGFLGIRGLDGRPRSNIRTAVDGFDCSRYELSGTRL